MINDVIIIQYASVRTSMVTCNVVEEVKGHNPGATEPKKEDNQYTYWNKNRN